MRFVVPKISMERARKILPKRRRLSLGRKREMRKLELVYLPYYLHRASVAQGDDEHTVLACTDGISSGFSFFDGAELELSDRVSGTALPFCVSLEESRRVCLENLRWHVLRQRSRFRGRARVKELLESERIYYPYWVAYFKGRRGYDFRAADAVTGTVQGVRMRAVFLTAFSQAGGENARTVTAQN